MTRNEIRAEIERILKAHDEAIATIRATRGERLAAFDARDAAIGGVIEANRAAIRLLGQLDDRGTPPKPFWDSIPVAVFQLVSWIFICIYALWQLLKK